MNPTAVDPAVAVLAQLPAWAQLAVQGGAAVVSLVYAVVVTWALVSTARELARVQDARIVDARTDATADREQAKALTQALTEFRSELRELRARHGRGADP